ncbi:hypothetical protein GG344DRAFT_63787 [Lentinula edodes]|nr:hypothetical protein GG344DRAFT_63787 [Lentinula edodes]
MRKLFQDFENHDKLVSETMASRVKQGRLNSNNHDESDRSQTTVWTISIALMSKRPIVEDTSTVSSEGDSEGGGSGSEEDERATGDARGDSRDGAGDNNEGGNVDNGADEQNSHGDDPLSCRHQDVTVMACSTFERMFDSQNQVQEFVRVAVWAIGRLRLRYARTRAGSFSGADDRLEARIEDLHDPNDRIAPIAPNAVIYGGFLLTAEIVRFPTHWIKFELLPGAWKQHQAHLEQSKFAKGYQFLSPLLCGKMILLYNALFCLYEIFTGNLSNTFLGGRASKSAKILFRVKYIGKTKEYKQREKSSSIQRITAAYAKHCTLADQDRPMFGKKGQVGGTPSPASGKKKIKAPGREEQHTGRAIYAGRTGSRQEGKSTELSAYDFIGGIAVRVKEHFGWDLVLMIANREEMGPRMTPDGGLDWDGIGNRRLVAAD